MDTEETETLRLLLGLYLSCRESGARYRAAAARETDSDLRFLFRSCCRRHARFAEQLLELVCAEKLEREPGKLRPVLRGKPSQRRLLEEFSRLEETLLTKYRQALKTELPSPVRKRVLAQCKELETVRARMAELCRLEQAS